MFSRECSFPITGYDVQAIVYDFMYDTNGTDWDRSQSHLRQV